MISLFTESFLCEDWAVITLYGVTGIRLLCLRMGQFPMSFWLLKHRTSGI